MLRQQILVSFFELMSLFSTRIQLFCGGKQASGISGTTQEIG